MADLVRIRGVDTEPPDPVNTLQQVLSDGGRRIFDIAPNILAEIISGRKWIGRRDFEGREFRSFEDFASRPLWDGLGCTTDDLLAICRKREDVKQLIRGAVEPQPTHVDAGTKGGRGNKATDNVSGFYGNASTYALKRLKRDAPELFDRVVAGELSANAAAIEAGFRKKLTPFEQVKRLIPKLTADERQELRGLL